LLCVGVSDRTSRVFPSFSVFYPEFLSTDCSGAALPTLITGGLFSSFVCPVANSELSPQIPVLPAFSDVAPFVIRSIHQTDLPPQLFLNFFSQSSLPLISLLITFYLSPSFLRRIAVGPCFIDPPRYLGCPEMPPLHVFGGEIAPLENGASEEALCFWFDSLSSPVGQIFGSGVFFPYGVV